MSDDTLTRIHPETGMKQVWRNEGGQGRFVDVGTVPPTIPAHLQSPQPSQAADMANAAVAGAMTPTQSASRDSISAEDRARGLNVRLLWPMSLTALLALVATLAWSLALTQLGTPKLLPFMLDRIGIFLLVLGGMGYYVWLRSNDQEYKHSHAGIRHKQLDIANEMHERTIDAELKRQRMALDATLGLIEDEDYGIE